MRRLYWQPRKVSRIKLVLIALWSLCGYVAVEYFLTEQRQPYFDEKMQASRLAQTVFEAIKVERARLGLPIDPESDPSGSGLVGEVFTPITSGSGSLASKQTTVNPNFAALMVHWLKRLGVEEDDVVAVGCSGSFPALNIAVYAALKTLHLRPIIISSAAASQWGANHPDFTWLDMESMLRERGLFMFKSVAASRGGIGDRGLGLPKSGRQMLDAAIERNGLPQIDARDDVDSVDQRMGIYFSQAAEQQIKAYINVGGGTISVGTRVQKLEFEPGITARPPRLAAEITSVMGEFLKRDIPVIHLSKIVQLATSFGFEVAPVAMPAVGSGKVFVRTQYNRWLAAAVLLSIVVVIAVFVQMRIRLEGEER
ncbi:MAG: poly-gamma-glutamate system protein [Deltaproteobacteria bacterium]|nr:poly-gamma-glutamate system protein [Deltaproteobacteria bacterium]